MAIVADLAAGFADPVLAAQSTFRAVMNAMAQPGTIQSLRAGAAVAPMGLAPAAAALALTLCDHDTPIWLDSALAAHPEIAAWLKFHTGAPVTDETAKASFGLVAHGSGLPGLESFALGSAEYPDRSTTLILEVASLGEGCTFELRGPGIDGSTRLPARIAPEDLFDRLAMNERLFPRGIDVVLVHGDKLVAIPRTTRLVATGG